MEKTLPVVLQHIVFRYNTPLCLCPTSLTAPHDRSQRLHTALAMRLARPEQKQVLLWRFPQLLPELLEPDLECAQVLVSLQGARCSSQHKPYFSHWVYHHGLGDKPCSLDRPCHLNCTAQGAEWLGYRYEESRDRARGRNTARVITRGGVGFHQFPDEKDSSSNDYPENSTYRQSTSQEPAATFSSDSSIRAT